MGRLVFHFPWKDHRNAFSKVWDEKLGNKWMRGRDKIVLWHLMEQVDSFVNVKAKKLDVVSVRRTIVDSSTHVLTSGYFQQNEQIFVGMAGLLLGCAKYLIEYTKGLLVFKLCVDFPTFSTLWIMNNDILPSSGCFRKADTYISLNNFSCL